MAQVIANWSDSSTDTTMAFVQSRLDSAIKTILLAPPVAKVVPPVEKVAIKKEDIEYIVRSLLTSRSVNWKLQ